MLHFADALVNHLYRYCARVTNWMVLDEPSKKFISEFLVVFPLFGEHALLKLAKALAILLGSVKPSTDTDSLHLLLTLLTYFFPECSGIF